MFIYKRIYAPKKKHLFLRHKVIQNWIRKETKIKKKIRTMYMEKTNVLLVSLYSRYRCVVMMMIIFTEICLNESAWRINVSRFSSIFLPSGLERLSSETIKGQLKKQHFWFHNKLSRNKNSLNDVKMPFKRLKIIFSA